MIDICMVIHNNYELAKINAYYWNNHSDYRLLICDNTPRIYKRSSDLNVIKRLNNNIEIFEYEIYGEDGETHGLTLDYLISKTETDVVGTIDTDFFWLRKDIIQHIETLFEEGYEAVGAAGWYPDWQEIIDIKHPDRAGHLAPVCWGQFLLRAHAISNSFESSAALKFSRYETGWRVRKHLIDNNIKMIVYPGFKFEEQKDDDICFFGDKDKPIGMHLLKGSLPERYIDYDLVRNLILDGYDRWNY